MSEIRLSDGRTAIIDRDDIVQIRGLEWFVVDDECGYPHAVAIDKDWGVEKMIIMEQLLMSPGSGEVTIHKSKNTLDNRQQNLKRVEMSILLLAESRKTKTGTIRKNGFKSSKHVGVSWNKQRLKWRAQLMFKGKRVTIGHYNSELQAAMSYRKAKEGLKTYQPSMNLSLKEIIKKSVAEKK